MKDNNQLYFMFFLVLFVAVMTWKPIVESPKNDVDALIEAKLSESLAGLQSQAEDFQTKVNTLETANSSLQTQADVLEAANSNLQESVNALEAANSTLQTSINALETENSNLQTKVGTLETENSTLQTSNSTIQTLLSGVSRLKVGGYDTLRFSGINVQIVNGTGATHGIPNGRGNLIVGYNELRTGSGAENIRTGSHYVVIGALHNYTAFGGIVNGWANTASGQWASVSGGSRNTAIGANSSVSGGTENTAIGRFSSILGGSLITLNTFAGIYPE